jgi:hypothetical protein
MTELDGEQLITADAARLAAILALAAMSVRTTMLPSQRAASFMRASRRL